MPKKPRRQAREEKRGYEAPIMAPQLPRLEAKTQTQGHYLLALEDYDQVIALGPAGTGKTYVAAAYAATLYRETRKQYGGLRKIIISRPNVAMGNTNGHLPGTIEEKSLPWAVPIDSVLQQYLDKGTYEIAVKNKDIEFVPVEFVRGRTFNDAFIIIDEAQNLTLPQLKGLLTRIGTNSTLVLCGDINQKDINNSGFDIIVNAAKTHRSKEISIIEFDIDDCVRSKPAKRWIELFSELNI